MKNAARPSVILIDDHDLFRQGLAALLEHDFEIRAAASRSADAHRLCESHRPDILILDADTGSDAVESTIRRIRRYSPSVVVFVLTMHDDAVLRRQLLAAGATDYATKAIDRASLVTRLNEALHTGPATIGRPDAGAEGVLSQRELEVLRLVAAAASNRHVGLELTISEGTVKRHLANIFLKLGAVSRIDAVRKARLHGLL